MKIVIMGCGRVGARLAQLFSADGHEVSVVDLHAEALARLGPEFHGHTQTGTGIDEDVLIATGIQGADLFIAVTDHDNANIMAAQIAKLRFNVPRAIARIYEPDREETFHRLGLETICPTTLVANRIYKAVTTGAGARIAPVQPPTTEAAPPTPPEAVEPSEPSAPAAHQQTNGRHGLPIPFRHKT